MKVKKRHHLRGGEVKKVLNALKKWCEEFRLEDRMEYVAIDHAEFQGIVLVKRDAIALYLKDEIVPTLNFALKNDISKGGVVVDRGAVPHIVRGADVMGPGVVYSDESIREGDTVFVKEEEHGKYLCMGKALVDGGEMVGRRGKVVKNVHYVGDSLWRFIGSL
ncbi:RNA-binding protein [Methanosarcinales archaeon]|nr:MAG: RNA-binding protein [Methanosarcinales archaeon]